MTIVRRPPEDAITYLLAQIAVLETTNARLRDELGAARYRIMRIANTAADARQRIETTLNDTRTDGVHYADQWPEKG